MKYAVTQYLKKGIAALVAAIISFTGGALGEPETPEIERPAANTVTAYSADDADYTLDIDAENEIHDISDLLFGIFFEDINFAADGGLYAEKVVNRSFEFTEIAADDAFFGWSTVNGAEAEVKLDDKENALNENNTNYLVITNTADSPAGVANRGFLDGISVEENAKYNFSVYAKGLDGYSGGIMFVSALAMRLQVRLKLMP